MGIQQFHLCGRTSTVNLMTIGHSHNKTVIPGKSELLNIEALDELGHNITNQTVFTVSIHRDNKSSQSVDMRAVCYVSDGCFDVGGPPDPQASLSLNSMAVSLNLNVTILPCLPGFVYNATQKRCKCEGGFGGLLHCEPQDFLIHLSWWLHQFQR